MPDAFARHWPEYFIEAALIGVFMLAACVAVTVFAHPSSPVARRWRDPHRPRIAVGVLMGLTAVALIYSPWGERSGAHMNPGVTLAFWALGKVRSADALFYIVFQNLGAISGVLVARLILGRAVAHPLVNFAVTAPSPDRRAPRRAAWLGEFAIAFVMMSTVLWCANSPAVAPFTGLLAGLLVAVFIAVEAPLSGMSMNPARSLGSALPARAFRDLWIYFSAPPLAMLAAAGLYAGVRGAGSVHCCKLSHPDGPCVFECRSAPNNEAARHR